MAPGAPIGAYAVECVMDEVAEALKMDPLDFRLKTAAKEGTKAAHGPEFPRMGFIETLEAAKNLDLYKARSASFRAGCRERLRFNAGGESSRKSTSPRTATSSSPQGHPDIGGSRAGIANIFAECSASTTAACRS